MPRVQRHDRALLSSPTVLGSGALRVSASVARADCVQVYRAGNEEWGELRIPDEVFAPASLETLRSVPVTIHHEGGPVRPGTWREQAHGHAGDTPRVEEPWIVTDLIVQSAEAIGKVRRRELVELSAGYTCDLELTPGMYQGQPYRGIQRNISWNHVSLLPPGTARAGSGARLHLDSAIPQSAVGVLHTMTIKVFKLDAKTATAKIGDTAYDLGDPAQIKRLTVDLQRLVPRMDQLDEPALRAAVQALEPHIMGLVENLAVLMAMVQEQAAELPPATLEDMEELVGAEVLDAGLARREKIKGLAKANGLETEGKKAIVLMREVLDSRGVKTEGLVDGRIPEFFDRLPDANTWTREDSTVARSGAAGSAAGEHEKTRKEARAKMASAWKPKIV